MNALGDLSAHHTRVASRVTGLVPVVPDTLVQQIARSIIEAAATGTFLPGQRLPEIKLVKELGVSRVPIREALRLLQSKGLVESQPYAGVRLMSVTQADVQELVQLRAALEVEALRTAMAKPQQERHWSDMREAVEQGESARLRDDHHLMVRADRLFHRALWQVAGNEVLSQELDKLLERQNVIRSFIDRTSRLIGAQAEHVALLERIEAGDLDGAEAVLNQHVRWIGSIDIDEAVDLVRIRRVARRD